MTLDMPEDWKNFWWCQEPDCGARACPLPGVGVLEAFGQHRATEHPRPAPVEDEVARARRQLLGDAIVDDKDSPVASAARAAFRLGWDAAVEHLKKADQP
jgi:hypothetical protein